MICLVSGSIAPHGAPPPPTFHAVLKADRLTLVTNDIDSRAAMAGQHHFRDHPLTVLSDFRPLQDRGEWK